MLGPQADHDGDDAGDAPQDDAEVEVVDVVHDLVPPVRRGLVGGAAGRLLVAELEDEPDVGFCFSEIEERVLYIEVHYFRAF